MFALSCLKVEILSFRRHRRNFMAARILVVDISIRGMSGFDFVTSEVPQTTGEGGAPFRIQSISKHVKAFRILAGHFLWVIWNRGTGVHRTVLQLGPYGYAPSDWGIGQSDIPEPFRGPHFVCQVLQVSPPTRFGPDYGPELRQAERLAVYLNANALRFDVSENNGSVRKPCGRGAPRSSL